MKLMNKQLVCAALICLILGACQKAYISENNSNPPAVITEGEFLDRIYVIDSTAGVKDTGSMYVFQYDNAKRITGIADSFVENGIWQRFNQVNYFYNGADTMPYKSVSYEFELMLVLSIPGAVDTTTTFYQYDASLRNRYDSSIHVYVSNPSPLEFTRFELVKKYQYAGASIYGESLQRDPVNSAVILNTRDTAQTDANGNILFSKRYLVDNGVLSLASTSSFTYDNKRNPFARLSIFRTLFVFPYGETFFSSIQARNNRLKAYEVHGGQVYDEDLTGKYVYNTNGYPSRIVYEHPNNPGSHLIYAFAYKSL